MKKLPLKVNYRSNCDKTLIEMIISDEPKIFEILEKYEQNPLEDELKENIIELLRPKRKYF